MIKFDIQKEVTGVIYVDDVQMYNLFGIEDGDDMTIDYRSIPYLESYIEEYIEDYELDKCEIDNIKFMMNMITELVPKCNKVQVRYKEM